MLIISVLVFEGIKALCPALNMLNQKFLVAVCAYVVLSRPCIYP